MAVFRHRFLYRGDVLDIILYSTNDGENILNKSLDEEYRFNIRLKNDTDIITPVITLNDKGEMNFNKCNYCYIEVLGRYYFIRSIENISNKIWKLDLECDVLQTYKDDILNSYAEVERVMKEDDHVEVTANTETKKTYEIYESDVTLEGDQTMILSSIGGAD